MTCVLLRVMGAAMPLRSTEQEESQGMDVAHHGEEVYVSGKGAILVLPEAGHELPEPVADRAERALD